MWIKISDSLPEPHETVLVACDYWGDGFPNFFVADYFEREHEWEMHLHFPGEEKDAPYIRIQRKVRKTDVWAYIVFPDFEPLNE